MKSNQNNAVNQTLGYEGAETMGLKTKANIRPDNYLWTTEEEVFN